MDNCKGSVSSVYFGSAVDGPGIRCVVFLSGCNLRCPYCHNPETFTKKGEEYTADSLVKTLLRYKSYLKNGGVTLSGGEPYIQPEFCTNLISRLKRESIHVAIETNGTILHQNLTAAADLLIVDIKNFDGGIDKRQAAFFDAASALNKPVSATNVITEGVNDDINSLTQLKKFAARYKNIQSVTFLPFKKMCAAKYSELNIPFPYADRNETTYQSIERVKALYREIDA